MVPGEELINIFYRVDLFLEVPPSLQMLHTLGTIT